MIRVASLVLALAIAFLAGASAAGEELHHAGLVVRHGDGRLIYAYVAFPEESISGVELLRRSGVSLVTIGFGGLGEGVCTIDGEGCPASDCRQRVCQGSGNDAPFWQYFRQHAPGEWFALSLGASATKVRDGDVDGWSWTGHDPALPPLTLHDVARLAGVPATPESLAVGVEPTPAVRIVYPAGTRPPEPDAEQGLTTLLAGIGAVVVIGGVVVLITRRRVRPERAT